MVSGFWIPTSDSITNMPSSFTKTEYVQEHFVAYLPPHLNFKGGVWVGKVGNFLQRKGGG